MEWIHRQRGRRTCSRGPLSLSSCFPSRRSLMKPICPGSQAFVAGTDQGSRKAEVHRRHIALLAGVSAVLESGSSPLRNPDISHTSKASTRFLRASLIVAPCVTQPGRSGASATIVLPLGCGQFDRIGHFLHDDSGLWNSIHLDLHQRDGSFQPTGSTRISVGPVGHLAQISCRRNLLRFNDSRAVPKHKMTRRSGSRFRPVANREGRQHWNRLNPISTSSATAKPPRATNSNTLSAAKARASARCRAQD